MTDRDLGPAEADALIARALESVLEAIPEPLGSDALMVESSPKSQPWAETAAPPGRNKRPLAEVVAELAGGVAANPDARAQAPAEPRPGEAYLESLTPTTRSGAKSGARKRWRGGKRRRGRGRRGGATAPG